MKIVGYINLKSNSPKIYKSFSVVKALQTKEDKRKADKRSKFLAEQQQERRLKKGLEKLKNKWNKY